MSIEKIYKGGNVIEVDIPDNIVNKVKYLEWVDLKRQLDSHVDTYFVCKSGKKINLKGLWSVIKKQIDSEGGLSKEEIKFCRDKSSWFKAQYSKLNQLEKEFYSLDGRKTNTNPFLVEKKPDLIELFGRWHTVKDVFDIVTREWGYRTTFNEIQNFFIVNKTEITNLRQDREKDLGDLSITSKKSRLEELNYLLEDRKTIYRRSHLREDSKEIRSILDQAKKEVEGERLALDISGKIDIDLTLQAEYQNEMLRGLTVNQIIIARVSARLQIKPEYIQSRLANSYYAKFNGFQKNDQLYEEQPIYPSTIVYDFGAIRQKSEERKKELEDAKIVENNPIQSNDDIRKRLKELLLKRQKELDESKTKVDKQTSR